MTPMFTCRELVEELREYLDGETPWYRRCLLGLHLLLCSACRAYLASYQATRRLVQGLDELDAGTGLPEDLSVRLHATLRRPEK